MHSQLIALWHSVLYVTIEIKQKGRTLHSCDEENFKKAKQEEATKGEAGTNNKFN